jgi:hypothetical protein
MDEPTSIRRLLLTSDADLDDVVERLFLSELLKRHATEIVQDSWHVGAGDAVPSLDGDLLEGFDLVVRHLGNGHRDTAFIRVSDALVLVQLGNGMLTVVAAASSPFLAGAAVEALRERAPEPVVDHGDTVSFVFWNATPHGHHPRHRRLPVQPWDEVAGNYPSTTREALGRLVDGFEPGAGGKLLLWHGEPGTGKTTAVRALASEWREWARFHVVVDPERFLGHDAEYLLEVVMSGRKGDDRWRVVVLEDTGELLSPDAKDRVGQGLSRLLNVVDGLIGQTARTLVVITSNEPADRMHPAVSRPGRCASSVRFELFDGEAAAAWLAERGRRVQPPVAGRTSLADLFALLDGRGMKGRMAVGFSPTY